MGRKACREYTMILLYQLEIQKDNREEQIERFFAENGSKCDDKEYMTDVLNGVHSHEKEIDSIIEEYSRGCRNQVLMRRQPLARNVLKDLTYFISFLAA